MKLVVEAHEDQPALDLEAVDEGIQFGAIEALRPLILYIAAPAALLFTTLEVTEHGFTPLLILQLVCALVLGAGFWPPPSRRLNALLGVALHLYAISCFLHYGALLGVGLLFCGATLSATFFFNVRGAVASVITSSATMLISTIGAQQGWLTVPHTPETTADWLRMSGLVAIATSGLAIMFTRIQLAMREALVLAFDARADQREAERARAQALEVATQAQRLEAAGRLASGVAHDFNNALLVLQGTIEELGLTDDPDERRGLVEEGCAAVESASSTARQLLGFARPRDESEADCQPGPLIERFVRSMGRILPKTLNLRAEVDRCAHVPLSSAVLEQILLNLVINARDACAGPGTIRVGCRTSPQRETLLYVADDGAGISDEIRTRLFEPFFTTKGPQQGTGLGLSMVRDLVVCAGGQIDVESSLGQGSCFTLRWPDATTQPQDDVEDTETLRPVGRADAHVLLVEDRLDVARVMTRTLTNAGYAVTCTHSLYAAERLLGDGRFDLLCTDALLPDGRATELISAYRTVYPRGAVLVCAGQGEHYEFGEAGTPLLYKPFSPRQLLAKVSAILGPPPSPRATGRP
ncbi:hypothetical protein G6O69_03380 [Pseudenhygromyxa sp. WMMC2535]|uniref:hybrid sensor histidine kinase/response regulator n=1 Tax=Pseudenhygromyxa sp. WMMC2535 TaxID=2712867 RepID=UPI001553718A|nr:ATP-binding protein [Pseudenhygromyxa sp. WMMC2535]NVB36856.1 hypothetical protein [Pseudenhygromyxa sp. WMMC2535]